MANAVFDAPHFRNEAAAFEYVEALLWPRGPVCPHCGVNRVGSIKGMTKPSKKHPEGQVRHGLRKCYGCRKTFTVRVGTIFEDSHLALRHWLQVIHLMTSSKKGISTRQIQRLLNCSMKTAWFLTHRIREIMKPGTSDNVPPMGGLGQKEGQSDSIVIRGNACSRKTRGAERGSESGRTRAGPLSWGQWRHEPHT